MVHDRYDPSFRKEKGLKQTSVKDPSEVSINSLSVQDVIENDYEEFLKRDKLNDPLDWPEVYWKYSTLVAFSGSVDAQFADQYLRLEFAGNNNDRESWSEESVKVNSNGSFSGVCDVRTNYMPSEITLVYADVWDK